MEGLRKNSTDCMARVITALRVCGEMNASTISFKSDVSLRTVIRVVKALEKEGLVTTRSNPNNLRSTLYTWMFIDDEGNRLTHSGSSTTGEAEKLSNPGASRCNQ